MISVLVASYGEPIWQDIASRRAIPSAQPQTEDLVVWHEPDGTVATSRNGAAARAQGDWLCFLDADDELAPGYLAAMENTIQMLGGHPDVATGGNKRVRARTAAKCGGSHPTPTQRILLTPAVQQIRRGPPGQPFFYQQADLKTSNWLVIGTLIQTDLFFEIGGFHEHPHGLEDWNLWARAARAGATIHKVPDAVYIAHINRNSKHRQLSRQRDAYKTAYEAARIDAWE